MVRRLYIRGCFKRKGMEMDGITPMPASLSIENYLINPPKTSVVIEIDSKTAKAILDTRNKKNRPPNPNKVQQFAADMTKDRWGLTGDTIKFGTNGQLLVFESESE
jgi:hypothetical protein